MKVGIRSPGAAMYEELAVVDGIDDEWGWNILTVTLPDWKSNVEVMKTYALH